MSNLLKNETSPYLLQHAENPVHWYPWGEEAFQKAKEEDKPVFLSIGYSTCHWCHVMAHESFEDEKTAELLNRHFVSVKVDREERPDIDSVYMSVCQAFTGSGGWPMTIFMTWDKKPFFAGTYFPVQSRYGMPGFSDLLWAIVNRWKENRRLLLDSAEDMITHLKGKETSRGRNGEQDLTEAAVRMFKQSFDAEHGGFGAAPKFPTPHNLLFLTLYSVRKRDAAVRYMVEKTLLHMRKGGIFDQIGYGFSRYSTDARFLAPHFEKMLYDNALLMMAYTALYRVTKKESYFEAAEKTADYVLREMVSSEGAFYSAQDADSEGKEGRFYTFTLQEIYAVLGKEAGQRFAVAFNITEKGNFEGVNIPNLLKNSRESDAVTAEFKEEIQTLYEYRQSRTKLHLDDKILLSWNSLMIAAFAMLYRVSGQDLYLQTAKRAQRFIEENMTEGKRLFASYRKEKRSVHGFLDDYAFYSAALLELYRATLETGYLERAEQICKEAERRFADKEKGGFFLCERESTELFMNPKETYDGAIPSGNSVMMYNLVCLYQLTENTEYDTLVKRQAEFMDGQAAEYPAGHSMYLLAKQLYENPQSHITVVLKEEAERGLLWGKLPFLANVTVVSDGMKYPLMNGKTTYYVCKDHVCLPPANEL